MAYNKKTWVSREIISKEALNNIEEGIFNLDRIIENLVKSISLGIHTDGAVYIFIDGHPVGSGILTAGDYFGSTDGYIDVNNNVITSNKLDIGIYTLKYENEDGTYITIGNFNISEEEVNKNKKVDINFIPQNIAPVGAKKIAIFDSNGNKINSIPLGNLAAKNLGAKLYSFGALSDVHLPYASQNASSDFQKALTYFNNVAHVDFICISGDMSDTGTDAEWLDYKNHVDAYSPNIPVHLSAGNHDVANGDMLYDYPVQYTGNPLWYSFEQNNDVFIMFGLRQWQGDNVFHNEALQWLYETLEENKDKRCFVFQHEMRLDGCGNAHGLYGWDGLAGRNGQVFLSLMEHYKNVIWFHGHSHTPFRLQSVQPTPIANYDRLHGCHSVHIPSLAIPRYGNSDVIFDAEGYIVDVYENGIHLRGIDFIEEEFVPIASYWIDTTPVEIPVNSYVDNRGVIKKKAISLPEGSDLIMNQRYSYSGNGLVTDTTTPTMFTTIMPVAPNTNYVLKIKNSNIEIPSASSSVVYGLNSSKMPAQHINGGSIPSMTTGITYSEDKKSADITFTTSNNVSYIALSLKAIISGTLKESDIVDYIIELEQSGNNDQPEIIMPEGTEVKVDTQFSESGGGFREMNGYRTYVIPVEPKASYKFNIANIPSANLNTEQAATMYELTADQAFNSRINGSKYIASMTNTVISEDCKSAEVNFVTTSNARYIAVSIIPGSNPDDIRITLTLTHTSIILPEGSELYLNQRYSYSNAQLTAENGMFTVFIPVDEYAGVPSIIRIKNSSIPLNVLAEAGNNSVIYSLQSDKTNLGHLFGSVIPSIPSDSIAYSADYKSADIYAILSSRCGYLALSLRVTNSLSTIISEDDIKNYIIEIEAQSIEAPDEFLNFVNLVSNSIDVDRTIYNSVGYKNNTYMSTSNNLPTDTNNAYVTTGLIENPENHVLYVYGATFDTTNSYCRIAGYNESMECVQIWAGGGTSINVTDIGNGIQRIKLISSTLINCSYIRFSFEGVGDNLYICNKANETMLEKGNITNSVTWTMDKRLSSAGDPDKDNAGAMASDYILVNPGDMINIYGISSLAARSFYINLYKDETFIHNIALSNEGMNPTDNKFAYAKYDNTTGQGHLTIQIKYMLADSIRVCCVASTVEVYRNVEDNRLDPIVLPEGSELLIGQRYSNSGGGYVADTDGVKSFVVTIPAESETYYLLTCKNLTIPFTVNGSTLYLLGDNKSYIGTVNGSNNFSSMIHGVTILDDGTGAEVEFVTTATTKYIVVSILAATINDTLTADDIKGQIITLEKIEVEIDSSEPKEITNNVTWTADTRLSSSDGSYKTEAGIHSSNDISVKRGDIIRIYGNTSWSKFAYVVAYNNDSVMLSMVNINDSIGSNYFTASKDGNNVLTIEIINKNVSHIRVCSNGIIPSETRVSINKELSSYDIDGDYDEPHWFNVYVSSDTGQVDTNNTGYVTTAFLRYNNQNIYTFTVTEALAPYRVFFYDSSKTYITCTDQSEDLTCIIDSAPAGTAYFRIRCSFSNDINVNYNVTQRSTYNVTNLVPTSQSVDSTAVYNEVGYKENVYISTNTNVEETRTGYVLTGLIPYTITQESAPTIYIRGVELPDDDTIVRVTLYNSEKSLLLIMHTSDISSYYFTKETLGDKYYKLSPAYANSSGNTRLSDNIITGNAYISLGGKGYGEELIVTFDEPIE